MKSHNRLAGIIILVLVLCLTLITTLGREIIIDVAHFILERNNELKEYPQTGTCFCNDIGLTIEFNNNHILATYDDGDKYVIYVDFGGHLLFGDEPNCDMANYRWNKAEDYLVIEFVNSTGDIEFNAPFTFIRIS